MNDHFLISFTTTTIITMMTIMVIRPNIMLPPVKWYQVQIWMNPRHRLHRYLCIMTAHDYVDH